MSVSYHRTVCFITSVLLLTACESDADRLQRLNGDRAVACLSAQASRKQYEMVEKQPYSPGRDSLLREYIDDNTKCELATRDLNRFMRE